MKNIMRLGAIITFALLMTTSVLATNGDNLIGVGPISRAMAQNGTDVTGQPVKIKSELTENAIDFGLTWRF